MSNPAILDELDRNTPFLRVIVALILTVAAVGSGYWMFLGVLNEMASVADPTFAQVAAAVIVAVILSVLLSGGWWLLNSIIPRARTGKLKLAGVALALVYTFWAVSVSTLFNASGLYGEAAMITDLEEKTDALRKIAQSRLKQQGLLDRYLLLVGGQKASLCALAEAEAKRGVLTSARGNGAVSASLGSLCAQLTTAEARLSASNAELAAQSEKIRSIMAGLRQVLSDTALPVAERRKYFQSVASEIEGWAGESATIEIVDTIDAVFALLEGSVIAVSTENSAFGQRQLDNVDGLRRSLGEVAGSVRELGEKIRAQAITEFPSLRPLSPSEATIRYAPKYVAQASAAVGIDLWPIFAICAFAIAEAGRRRRRNQ